MKRRAIQALALALAVLFGAAGVMVLRYRFGKTVRMLAAGEFHPVAHKGSGQAILIQLADGARRLHLVGFQTGAGSDLQVCMVAAADCRENESVEKAGFIALGPLRDAERDQRFEVPIEIDLRRYRAVTIWSRKYRVNFTTAPLRLLE
jgi:Electron transfer DM13